MSHVLSLHALLNCLLVLSLAFASTATVSAQTWSGGGADNNWSTTGNWVGGIAPVSNAATEVTFANPALRNSPFQNIANPFSLNRLTVNSTTGAWIQEGQPLRFTGGAPSVLWDGFNAITVNQNWLIEDTNFSTGGLNSTAVTLVHNADIGGTQNFTLSNGRSLTSNGTFSGAGRIIAGGTNTLLTVNGTVAASVEAVQIGLNGNFSVNSGQLAGTGTINSVLTVAQSTAQDNTISSSGTLTANGVISLNGGTSTETLRLRVTAGTIAANGLTDIGGNGGLIVNAGAVVAGSGGIQVRNWGDLSVSGELAATKTVDFRQTNFLGPAGSVAVLSGAGVIQGAVDFGGGITTGTLTLNGGVSVNQFSNQAGAFFGTSGDTIGSFAFARSTLAVNGAVDFNQNIANLGGVEAGGNFLGNGTLNIGAATANQVRFHKSDVGSGLTVNIAGGAELSVDGDGTTGSVFRNQTNLNGGLLTTSFTTFTATSSIETSGNSVISVGSSSNFDGLVTAESGTLTVGGIMEGTGSLTIADGASQQLQNAASRMRLVLNVEGNLNGTAGSLIENSVNLLGADLAGPLAMTSVVNVLTEETSTLAAGTNMAVTGLTSINEGVLRVAAAATLTGSGALAVNHGAALHVQGLVIKNTSVAEEGRIFGTGELRGITDVDGLFDPGNSAGTIGVNGSIDLKTTSTVTIEIGGTTPGTGFDEILGLGTGSTANLGGGTLALRLIGGFIPDPGQQFNFMNGFSGITGTFGNGGDGDGVDRIYFADGSFAIEYQPTQLRLFDFQAAIPEPSAIVLLAGIGLWMAGARRRSVAFRSAKG